MQYRLTIVLLFALFARAVVPAGFMLAPSRDDPAKLSVVICTEHGAQKLTLDDEGNPAPEPAKAPTASDVCPYGASVMTGFAVEVPQLAANVLYAEVAYVLAHRQFSETPQPGATSARGPPQFV